MPDLLLFAPCERILIEEGSHVVSLIAVIQELRATDVPQPLAADALAAQRWFVLANWKRRDDDADQKFEQRVTLEGPDGKVFFDVRTEFEMSQQFHRNVGEIGVFPIAASGDYMLRLSLGRAGQVEVKEVARYPIVLTHISTIDSKPA